MPKIKKKAKKPAKQKPTSTAGVRKKEERAMQALLNSKKILTHIPTQADIEGKSFYELAIIWGSILESEKALNRDNPDFRNTYEEHCEALRRISRLRRKMNGEPDPILRK